MNNNPKSETVSSGGAVWYVRNRNVVNSPNTEPAGLDECFLCGRGMVYRGSRFCSPRCRKAFDCGFPRHDPHHVRTLMSPPLRSWKVAAPTPGGPLIGSSYYGPILGASAAGSDTRAKSGFWTPAPEAKIRRK
jgi:hypothetical protein